MSEMRGVAEMIEAQSLSGESRRSVADSDILRILNFPNDTDWKNILLLIFEPGSGPYDLHDFVPAVNGVIDLKDIVHFGANVVTHVFTIGLKTESAVNSLLSLNEIRVKGKRCRIIPIENRKVVINVHWLPPVLSHDLVKDGVCEIECTRSGACAYE
ncbi:uncharacterized protein LOC111628195 [Centruroides sculpturatus]|uniref:uncharacterized protein LOC111628195 n=1 Tax=Centruroides sculpturatus TaxID=218467 RepID=UPI000C6DFE79|nr:uncharacterized protein LOC111628195 [Centruroides sculpturatus]